MTNTYFDNPSDKNNVTLKLKAAFDQVATDILAISGSDPGELLTAIGVINETLTTIDETLDTLSGYFDDETGHSHGDGTGAPVAFTDDQKTAHIADAVVSEELTSPTTTEFNNVVGKVNAILAALEKAGIVAAS